MVILNFILELEISNLESEFLNLFCLLGDYKEL